MNSLVQLLYRLNLFLGTLFISAIVLLTVLDVVLRYFFDSPIFGASEAVQYLLGLTIFSGMFLVTKDGGHVSVSLLDSILRDQYPGFFLIVFRIFSFVGIGLLAVIMVWKFLDVVEYPELSVVLEIPLEYVIGLFSMFCFVVLLAAVTSEMGSGEHE